MCSGVQSGLIKNLDGKSDGLVQFDIFFGADVFFKWEDVGVVLFVGENGSFPAGLTDGYFYF